MKRASVDIFWLTLLQAIQLGIPILTIPHLASALGPSGFGTLALVVAIWGYWCVLAEWGFGISGVADVAAASGSDRTKQIIEEIFIARLALTSVSLSGCIATYFALGEIEDKLLLFMMIALQVGSTGLSVSWALQGLAKLPLFAITSAIPRLLTWPATILLVQGPGDVWIAAGIQAAASTAAAAAGLWIVRSYIPRLHEVARYQNVMRKVRSSFSIFLSQAAVTLYSQTNIAVLSAISGAHETGVFSAADRIRRAVQAGIGPISGAFFPRISALAASAPRKALHLCLKVMLLQGSLGGALGAFLFFGAPWVVQTFLGQGFESTTNVLRLMSPLPFLVGVNNALGVQLLVPCGYKNTFTAIIVVAGIANLAALLILCPHYGALGAAVALLFCEALVTVIMALSAIRISKRIAKAASQERS